MQHRPTAVLDCLSRCAAASALPFLVTDRLPLTDLPEQPAEIAVWRSFHHPRYRFDQLYQLDWITPYLFGYVLVRVVAAFVAIDTAFRVVLYAAVTALPLSCRSTSRSLVLSGLAIFLVISQGLTFLYCAICAVALAFFVRPRRNGSFLIAPVILPIPALLWWASRVRGSESPVTHFRWNYGFYRLVHFPSMLLSDESIVLPSWRSSLRSPRLSPCVPRFRGRRAGSVFWSLHSSHTRSAHRPHSDVHLFSSGSQSSPRLPRCLRWTFAHTDASRDSRSRRWRSAGAFSSPRVSTRSGAKARSFAR